MADKQVTVRRMWGGASRLGEIIKRRLSVNQALHEYNRLVILGDPGAGKTTLLKHITLAFAHQQSDRLGLAKEERLPIFIRLYDYVAKRASRNGDFSLVDYLYTQAHESLLLDLEPGFFEEELARGRCCVCLDGLDELGGAGLRREVTAAVAALVSRYPFNRYLVTSRVVGYDEAPLDRRDFVHHIILPFTDDDIERFVQKWYQAREPDPALARQQSKHLTETIMRESRIKTLAANPLMLTIIALVHRIEAELPYERVKLYDKCVTALVETWEKVKRIKIEDRERPYYRKRRQLLEQLSFWLHTQPLEGVSGTGQASEVEEGDLKARLAHFLLEDPNLKLDKRSAWQEAEDFIAMAKSRTGLLVERGDGVYAFAHLTFQEYLAAAHLKYEYIHSIDEIWAVVQPHLHNPHWREVLLLLLGSLNEFRKHPTELVRRIYESTDEYEDVLHRHLYLAARALADRVEVDTALHDEIVDRLLEIARSDWLGGEDAFAALKALSDDHRTATGLLALAQDNTVEAWARRDAVQALEQAGCFEEAILSRLLALAHDSSVDDRVRRAAVQALGRSGHTGDILPNLLDLARDNTVEAWVRRDVAQVLDQLGQTDDAIDVLLALTRDNTVDAGVRTSAAYTLSQLSSPDKATDLLLAVARDETMEAWVRRNAAQALGQLGWTDDATDVLLALSRDETVSDGVRRDAVRSLGQLEGADNTAGPLLALAHDNTIDNGVRRAAIQALSRLSQADKAILSTLLTLARDNTIEDWMQCDVARALLQSGQPDVAIELLLALIHDDRVEAWVRCDAAEALGQLGHTEEAINLLLILALDEAVEAWVRCDAAQHLGQLGHVSDATDLLLELVHKSAVKNWVRREAAQALGQLGHTNEAVLSGLLTLVDNSIVDDGIRRDAVRALGQLGQANEAVLSNLLALARDENEDSNVRSAAYQSLKVLLGGGEEGLP